MSDNVGSFSICKSCDKKISISSGSCVGCGDSDPLLMNQIHKLSKKIIFFNLASYAVSLAIIFIGMGFAVYVKSWGFLVASGVVSCIFVLTESKSIEVAKEIAPPILLSFLNYLKINKSRFNDYHDAYNSFHKELFDLKLETEGNIFKEEGYVFGEIEAVYNQS